MSKVVELIIGIGLAATGIGLAVAGVALFGLTVAGTALAVIGAGASMILGGAAGMLAKPPSLSALTQQGNSITVKQSAAPRVVVYGRSTIAGVLTYVATTGASNEFLHLVHTFVHYEGDAIEAILFDQYALVLSSGDHGNETSKYNGFLSVERKLGTVGEAAFAGLITDTAGLGASAWTSTCRQDGCVSLHFKLKWDQTAWPTGVPNIRIKLRGKKIFDPRTSTTVWSNNWALCTRDWLTDSLFGLKCPASESNDTLLNAAANLSDEAVSLLAGGTEARYTCNGTYDASKTRGTVIQALLTAGAGRLSNVGGQWSLYGGAWRAPALSLGDDDFRAGLQLTARRSRRDLFSGVKGDFIDPNNDWQTNTFPGMVLASYVADDSGIVGAVERGQWLTATAYGVNDAVMSNGFAYVCTSAHTSGATTQPGVGASWPTVWQLASELNWKTVSYPFTTSASTCQRLAKIDLETFRRGIQLAAPCKLGGYLAQPPEVVQITHADFLWASKTFEIVQCDLTPARDGAWGVDFQLQESDANVYAWSTAFEQSQQPLVGVSVADPSVAAAPTGLTLLSGATTALLRGDGIKLSRIQVTWTAPTDQFVLSGGKIFGEYQLHASGNWQPAFETDGATTIGFIQGVNDAVAYDVRVRSRNIHDVYSAWIEVDNHVVSPAASNYSYRPLSNPLTATDAGSSDTIPIAAFTMRVGGTDKSINSGSISSLSRGTLYYIYYDDPTIAGGSVSFSATTTKEVALQNYGRFFVGSIVTPAAGGANTVGNNDGGGGAQNGSTFILSGSTYSPDNGTTWFANVTSDTIAKAASDGNSATSGGLASNGSSPGPVYLIGGFPAIGNNWSSIVVKAKLSTGMGANPTPQPRVILQASSDNFATAVTIASAIGLGSDLALAIYSGTLPNNTNMGNFEVRITMQGATGSVLLALYELWVEAQL